MADNIASNVATGVGSTVLSNAVVRGLINEAKIQNAVHDLISFIKKNEEMYKTFEEYNSKIESNELVTSENLKKAFDDSMNEIKESHKKIRDRAGKVVLQVKRVEKLLCIMYLRVI